MSSNAQAWNRAARRLAARVNFGWWLQTVTLPLLVVGLAGTFVLLFLRRGFPEIAATALALATAAALGLVALVGWWLARRRFEKPDTALVRLEAHLGLHNALTAARDGVARWPDLPSPVESGLRWHWRRVLVAPLLALAFLAAGLFFPLSALPDPQSRKIEEPLAWQRLESDLDQLEEDEVADETYLEEMREKLEEMRATDEEEWFSHSSLEATDSLEQQHRSEIGRLERELSRADRALGSLQRNGGTMNPEQRDQLLQQFDQALQGLENGALKPNGELLEQLRQLDPQNLGQLSQEQLKQLRENLQKAGHSLQDLLGKNPGGGAGEEWLDELLDGQGEGQGQGGEGGQGDQPGDGPGKGGVQRGPGHAPGVLGKEGDPLALGDLEGLSAEDLSRALPGDLLQLQDGQHQTDQSPSQTQSGGAIGSAGQGGDRVWKESLDPDEQRALKRYFE